MTCVCAFIICIEHSNHGTMKTLKPKFTNPQISQQKKHNNNNKQPPFPKSTCKGHCIWTQWPMQLLYQACLDHLAGHIVQCPCWSRLNRRKRQPKLCFHLLRSLDSRTEAIRLKAFQLPGRNQVFASLQPWVNWHLSTSSDKGCKICIYDFTVIM